MTGPSATERPPGQRCCWQAASTKEWNVRGALTRRPEGLNGGSQGAKACPDRAPLLNLIGTSAQRAWRTRGPGARRVVPAAQVPAAERLESFSMSLAGASRKAPDNLTHQARQSMSFCGTAKEPRLPMARSMGDGNSRLGYSLRARRLKRYLCTLPTPGGPGGWTHGGLLAFLPESRKAFGCLSVCPSVRPSVSVTRRWASPARHHRQRSPCEMRGGRQGGGVGVRTATLPATSQTPDAACATVTCVCDCASY